MEKKNENYYSGFKVQGLYGDINGGIVGILQGDKNLVRKNQVEKKMASEMETGFIGIRVP